MNNSFLVELIKSQNPKVHSEIEWYLKSPFCNTGKRAKEIQMLFQCILEAAPDFEQNLSKTHIYAKIFPGEKVIAGKIEKLMVDLNKQIRNFLLVKKYLSPENEEEIQLNWVSWLREEGFILWAEKYKTSLKLHIQKSNEESLEQLRWNLKIAEEDHELESLQNQLNNDLAISKLIDSLDLFYNCYKLELLNRYALQQKAVPLPEMPNNILPNKLLVENSMMFAISTKIQDLIVSGNPSPRAVNTLMEELGNNEAKLSRKTNAHFYAFLRNLCTILINNGRIDFNSVLHKLHLDNLEKGLFMINNEIGTHAYMSIVHIAIQVQEADWALGFTHDYKNKLIGGDPNSFFYQFNHSKCLFALKRYDAALTNLPDPSLHPHYQGTIRCLELKIYYELQSELLLYKMYAFRKYFERTATKIMPNNWRTMYIEFFNIMLQLTQSPPKDKKRSQQLIERINKKKLLADRAWLLEKARELG